MEDALITRLVIATAAAGLLLIFGLGMLVEHPKAVPLSGQFTAAGQKDREKQVFVLEPIQWAREPVRDPNAPSWVWRSHYRLSGATMSKEPSTVAGFARN
jgi:hypothetical protein